MRQSVIRIMITILVLGFSAIEASGDSKSKAPAPVVDLSRGHLPLMQHSTSETEAHFNLLVPRLVNATFYAIPEGSKDPAAMIKGEILGDPSADPAGELHDKGIKFRFTGLKPNVNYELQIVQETKYEKKIRDRRKFKTMSQTPRPLKFATISCMCDEITPEFEAARQAIWPKVIGGEPDMIFLLGDQTYVDSFDYVERHKATEKDVWTRYFRAFSENPLFRSAQLIPVFAITDDHDRGVDNANKTTGMIMESLKPHLALYGAANIPGVVETSKVGAYLIISVAGHNFVMLDDRSFRTPHTENDRYGHFGQEQEEWLLAKMKTLKGPFHLMNGDMWGSETITQTQANGNVKRVTESFYGDHPLQYTEMMKAIHALGVVYDIYTGDIHFSQLIEHGPQHAGKSRYAPFRTVEVTSSPIHSFIFRPKPGDAAFWTDDQRIVGVKEFNFIMSKSKVLPDGSLDLMVESIGQKDEPYFSWGTTVSLNNNPKTDRRQILSEGFKIYKGKKVQVAFFDADDTLRIAPSKSVSASSPTDVAILPGAADKIADLVKAGYMIVIVSNQGGVAAEKVSFETADGALKTTMKLLREQNPGAIVHYYDMGERGHADYYSKPNIGMGLHLERVLKAKGLVLDWGKSFMVGDAQYSKDQISPRGIVGEDFSDSDRKFAENLRIRTFHPRDFFKWTLDEIKAIKVRDVPGFQRRAPVCREI